MDSVFWILYVLGGLSVALCIYNLIIIVLCLIRKKEVRVPNKEMFKEYRYIIIISILIFLGITIKFTPFGSTQIGNLFERCQYKEYYYVNLFPENAESKNYKVKAQIEKIEDQYFIIKAFFPNGGYITFEDSYGFDSLVVNKKTSIIDDNNKNWDIILTKEKYVE